MSEGEYEDINVGAPRVPDQTAQTVGSQFSPVRPKMGGLRETGPETTTPWTGGKPKADWSGLENNKPESIQPTQYRPTSVSAQAKGRYYRTLGLDTKLTRDGDILAFQREVQDHLEDHGLDTNAYLKDPGDSSKVILIIMEHGRFNHTKACKEANDTALLFHDEYDHANDRDAKKFLLNSLDDDLTKQLLEMVYKKDCFAMYWLELMHIV